MKTLTAAVVVAVLLAVLCVQQNRGVPVVEVREGEEPVSAERGGVAYEKMLSHIRQKRGTKCRPCCNASPFGGVFCGVCCSF